MTSLVISARLCVNVSDGQPVRTASQITKSCQCQTQVVADSKLHECVRPRINLQSRSSNLTYLFHSNEHLSLSTRKTSSMKRTTSVRDKVRAQISRVENKFRKKPVVTPEQKLTARIDTMATQAEELHDECHRLRGKVATFTTRAETTQAPEIPPPEREPLFSRDSKKAPPSQYDTQLREYGVLVAEWHAYEKELRAFDKKFDKFVETVDSMKRDNVDPVKPMGKTEHDFESLDNAIFNLKEQRAELGKAVSEVPLPGGGK